LPASREQSAATEERRKNAVALRLAGAAWQAIADQLGYASRGAACEDVRRAMALSRAELAQSANELRETELSRLDRLQAALWTKAINGDVKAVDAALKIIDRRIRLLGLDAPQQVEVFTVDAVTARIRALADELGVPVPERVQLALPAGGDGTPANAPGTGAAES
jgi:hypothetical protein